MSEFREIPLSAGKTAKVSPCDYEMLARHNWSYSGPGYASRRKQKDGIKRHYYMHRVIADPPEGMEVDHINGDRLDNRRENLRVCTTKQNRRNRHDRRGVSRHKGVYWYKKNQRWYARIKVDGKDIALGGYADEDAAGAAYDAAAIEHFGEYAELNFPTEAVNI